MDKHTIRIVEKDKTDYPCCGISCSELKKHLDILDMVCDQYSLERAAISNPCIHSNAINCKIDVYKTMGTDYIM